MRNVAWVQWAMLLLYGCEATPPSAPPDETPAAEDSKKPGTMVSDDGKFDSTPSPDSGLGVMSFSPDALFSGFDGEHTFKVPIAVYDAADDLVLSAKDPNAATIVPVKLANPVVDGVTDNGKYFMVTPKKAGAVVLVAKSKGRAIEATLTVAAYTSAQWAAGKQRYENAGANGDAACT